MGITASISKRYDLSEERRVWGELRIRRDAGPCVVLSSDWLETYTSHFEEFYSELVETVEAPATQIVQELPTAFFARAAQSVFDDFLTSEYESTPENALDQ